MKPQEILKSFELKVTYARVKVLEVFQRFPFALSQSFLEKNTEAIDRVTLYRTLNTFQNCGLIHQVIDDSCVLKYALCASVCNFRQPHHKHEHLHFQCVQCNQTTCIDVHIPFISLPEGYQAQEFYFSVKGICKHCTTSNRSDA